MINPNPRFNTYRVLYEFVNAKFGFQNSITLESTCEEFANRDAMIEIEKCYGSNMIKRFKIVKTIKL